MSIKNFEIYLFWQSSNDIFRIPQSIHHDNALWNSFFTRHYLKTLGKKGLCKRNARKIKSKQRQMAVVNNSSCNPLYYCYPGGSRRAGYISIQYDPVHAGYYTIYLTLDKCFLDSYATRTKSVFRVSLSFICDTKQQTSDNYPAQIIYYYSVQDLHVPFTNVPFRTRGVITLSSTTNLTNLRGSLARVRIYNSLYTLCPLTYSPNATGKINSLC